MQLEMGVFLSFQECDYRRETKTISTPKCERLDKEIDQLVYQLYGLTVCLKSDKKKKLKLWREYGVCIIRFIEVKDETFFNF